MTDPHAGGTGQMYALIRALPAQLAASADLPGLDAITAPDGGFSRLLLCGMGGSAIAGDLVQPLLHQQAVPLDVWRDYHLPHWVDHTCLVIVASYSGNTEESLSGLAEARRRGCPVIGITSGGLLAAAAGGQGGGPFPCVTLPGGLPPRASLGYGLGALVRVLDRLGLVGGGEAEIAAAVRTLEELNPPRLHPAGRDKPSAPANDPAGMLTPYELAGRLVGRIPVIYAAGRETTGAAVRLKGQLNENSKVPACLAFFPELDHNDLVGWELSGELRDRFVLLLLRDGQDHPRLDARVEITRDLLAAAFPEIHEIRARGESPLARVLSLVQYGDYLSCHLARLKGVDPVPVQRIDQLKKRLADLETD